MFIYDHPQCTAETTCKAISHVLSTTSEDHDISDGKCFLKSARYNEGNAGIDDCPSGQSCRSLNRDCISMFIHVKFQ